MNSLARCCLFTLRFDSDAGLPMALCACCSIESFDSLCLSAFSHRIFSRLDDASRHTRLAESLERALLDEAGVACKVSAVIEEDFLDQDSEPITSRYVEIRVQGKINARKSSVIESALSDWMSAMFPGAWRCLPAGRPVPFGSSEDMAALRAGWRAEAEARGFTDSNPQPASAIVSSATECFAKEPLDGYPAETKTKRKAENKSNTK